MTVKELRDKLDNYIKQDPPNLWQLNDCELDALYYKERCEERGNKRVVIMQNSFATDVKEAYASSINNNVLNGNEEIFELII